MTQGINNGSGNIQVNGNGNVVFQGQPQEPPQDNPNLITCPACGKYGVYRDADVCPSCHYSFLNARLAAQAAARRDKEKGLQWLSLFLLSTAVIAMFVSGKFAVGFWRSLGFGAIGALLLFTAWLWLQATLSTQIKKWQGKI